MRGFLGSFHKRWTIETSKQLFHPKRLNNSVRFHPKQLGNPVIKGEKIKIL